MSNRAGAAVAGTAKRPASAIVSAVQRIADRLMRFAPCCGSPKRSIWIISAYVLAEPIALMQIMSDRSGQTHAAAVHVAAEQRFWRPQLMHDWQMWWGGAECGSDLYG
jgi:hypothetical protein